MNRRHFLRMLGYASASMAIPFPKVALANDFEPYTGQCLVTIQANGGWDVSSFCDPKVNTESTVLNNWAVGMTSDDLPKAGNIPYAPFADNATLFEQFNNSMLVINGVDMQTNAHGTGRTHTWSGRTARGYPSLTSMFAYEKASQLPVSYLNFGGYSETGNLIRFSRIDKVGELRRILEPNVTGSGSKVRNFYPKSELDEIIEAQQARLARLANDTSRLPRQRSSMASYYEARPNVDGLEHFASVIPDDSEIESSRSLSQAQMAILGFKAGVTSAADIELGGFDTHTNHDALHEPVLTSVVEVIKYLWDYAEIQGVADRLTVVVGSDFARTPYYNSSEGKNHWPIGSYLIMKKNAPWANRVIGQTDEYQNALPLNPQTLKADGGTGSQILHPMHIHSALRKELGLSTNGFPFTNTEEFDFFNPALG